MAFNKHKHSALNKYNILYSDRRKVYEHTKYTLYTTEHRYMYHDMSYTWVVQFSYRHWLLIGVVLQFMA